jgi:hypothetical protein
MGGDLLLHLFAHHFTTVCPPLDDRDPTFLTIATRPPFMIAGPRRCRQLDPT